MGVHEVTVKRCGGAASEVFVMKRVYWTATSSVGMLSQEYETYESAVEAARARIKTFDYTKTGGGLVDTVPCVALRGWSVTAPMNGGVRSLGRDEELLRFEVYRDRVVVVPAGQGGLSDEQAEASKRAVEPLHGAELRFASDER